MDESGLQLNNRPGAVLATKGSSRGHNNVDQKERNCERDNLSSICKMKGKNKNAEFKDDLSPDSVIYMSPKKMCLHNHKYLYSLAKRSFYT